MGREKDLTGKMPFLLDQLLLALADSTAERCALLFSSSTTVLLAPFARQERHWISAGFCFCWQEQVALDERRKSFGYGAAGLGTTTRCCSNYCPHSLP